MTANIAHAIFVVNRHCDIAIPDNSAMRNGSMGVRLKHARKTLRGLTQAELASKSGVPQASISECETGEHKALSGTNLVRVALILRVNVDWLATGKGSMDAPDTPLSPEAVRVAKDWEVLAPEVRTKIADMIAQLAATARSFGKPVSDERVEAAYGQPGHKTKK